MEHPQNEPALLASLAGLSLSEQGALPVHSVHSWHRADPEALVEALEAHGAQLSETLNENLLSLTLHRLLRADDPGALATRLLAAEGAGRFFPTDNFTRSWAKAAPEAARAWAEALADGEQRRTALAAVEFASDPPKEAAAGVPIHESHRLLGLTEAARAWIETLPPDERAIAVQAVPELQASP